AVAPGGAARTAATRSPRRRGGGATRGAAPSRSPAARRLAAEAIGVAPRQRLNMIAARPLEMCARIEHDAIRDRDEAMARHAVRAAIGRDRRAVPQRDQEGQRAHGPLSRRAAGRRQRRSRHRVVVRETSFLVLPLVVPLEVFVQDLGIPKFPAMPTHGADVPAIIQAGHAVGAVGIRLVLAGLLRLDRGTHRAVPPFIGLCLLYFRAPYWPGRSRL